MSEEEIINYLEKVSKEKTIMPLDNYIQGLLDLYEKEKEKNKELLEGLKYRVNYCKLLEKELYDTDIDYEMELTKIEQKYIQELLNKEE